MGNRKSVVDASVVTTNAFARSVSTTITMWVNKFKYTISVNTVQT